MKSGDDGSSVNQRNEIKDRDLLCTNCTQEGETLNLRL